MLLISNITFGFDKYEEATLHFLDNNSIKGYGKITEFLGVYKIKFKLETYSKSDVWDDLIVKGLTIHREYYDIDFLYINVMYSSKPKLLEVIEIAEISLYVEVDSYWVSSNFDGNSMFPRVPGYRDTSYTFFVKKENQDEAINFSSVINFKKTAKEYFKNCPVLIKKIDSREFKRRDIEEIVYYYNDFCAD